MNKIYVKIFEEIENYRILYAGTDKQIAESVTIGDFDSHDYSNNEYASHTLQTWEDGSIIKEEHTDANGKEYEDE